MAKFLFVIFTAFVALVSGLPTLWSSFTAPAKFKNPGILVALPPQDFQALGSQKVQIQFGPFAVGNEAANGQNVQDLQDATRPCTGLCYIYRHRAFLNYVNGSEANINGGSVLKRSFISTTARQDSVCAENNELAFLSANERLPYDLGVNGTSKVGYLLPDATMNVYAEVVNYNPDAQEYFLVLEFEFVPGTAAGFQHLTPYYLDSSGPCGPSMLTAPPNTTIFDTIMPGTFSLPKSGYVYAVGGHVEDGGTSLELLSNGATLCEAQASYGGSASYVDWTGTPRVSSMTTCFDVGNQTAGDQWSVTGHYDLTQHPVLPLGSNPAPVVAAFEAFVLH
ncbi:hypothetical protein PG996_012857 [Apiospora saccharicola]|uniref:Uncharacterized protein n=1 Tax=Apiospora saccharicola TaxID=335842 RepID=A0ABR1U5X1_9PEZI